MEDAAVELVRAAMTMQTAATTSPFPRTARVRGDIPPRGTLLAFVAGVSLCGAVVIVKALQALPRTHMNVWMLVLAGLTIAAGRFAVKVPGRSVTVSVSEIFVFTSLLLFGPAPATLTVAVDGLCIFAYQRNRRIDRGLFNIAEPAVSTWMAGTAFFVATRLLPTGASGLFVPAVAMAGTYFLLNSWMQAIAVALESGDSPLAAWTDHALYLAINYYAAASLATLAVERGRGLNLEVIGLVAPLLILSYAAYKVAVSRVDDSQRHIREVEHLYHATVETLAIAVDAKDQITHGHIRRVQRHTVAVARALGVTDEIELKALEAASLLHDVGKLAVPDYVLNKPGALSLREFDTMKRHAAIGAAILTTVEFPYPVVPVVRHHHEQWNGKGYPDGLSGEEIPLGARILTVVDCFDAVTSDRPYRRRMTDEQGTTILLERRGTMYDPRVVDAFVELVPQLRQQDRLVDQGSDLLDALMSHDGDVRTDAIAEATATPPLARRALMATIGPALIDKLSQTVPDAEVCLFVFEPGEDRLFRAHATPGVYECTGSLSIGMGDRLSGWVAANRHTIVNSHADLDLGDEASRLGLEACTASPVFAIGALVGVLSVYLPGSRRFTDPEVLAIGALAQEVGRQLTRHEHGFAFDLDAAAMEAYSNRADSRRPFSTH